MTGKLKFAPMVFSKEKKKFPYMSLSSSVKSQNVSEDVGVPVEEVLAGFFIVEKLLEH